jgi:excisionase family DNA binding protein
MKNSSRTTLLTAEELAGILSISEFTVRRLVREKQLPAAINKRRYQFNLEELLEYFRSLEGGAA